MRLLSAAAGAVAVLAVAGVRPGHAQAGGSWLWNYYNKPWCLSAADLNDCSYATFQQCNIARSGTGGSCYPNPRLAYRPDQSWPPTKARRSRE